jgi:hypothetical protein
MELEFILLTKYYEDQIKVYVKDGAVAQIERNIFVRKRWRTATTWRTEDSNKMDFKQIVCEDVTLIQAAQDKN